MRLLFEPCRRASLRGAAFKYVSASSNLEFGRHLIFGPAYIAMDMMSRLFSPYDLNLTGWNPL
jgi:hypothetical protein